MSAKTKAQRPAPATNGAHVEHAVSVVTGKPILIRCECPLGHDHTYADWLARFGKGIAR